MSPAPSSLIYLSETPHNAYKIQIAARATGINLGSVEEYDSKNAKHQALLTEHNPQRRLPMLITEECVLSNSNAIARYISKMRADSSLLGCGNFKLSCRIESLMEFISREVEVAAMVLVWTEKKYVPDADAARSTAVSDLGRALEVLEKGINGNKFLVGDKLSLADITLVCAVLDVFTDILGDDFRKKFPKIDALFDRCVKLEEFQTILKGKGLKKCAKSTVKFASFQPAPRTSSGSNAPQAKPQQPSDAAPQKGWVKPEKKPQQQNPPKAKAPAPAPAGPEGGLTGTPEEQAALQAVKDKVRDLKTAGKKAGDKELDAALAEMMRLKEVCGEQPPKKKKK